MRTADGPSRSFDQAQQPLRVLHLADATEQSPQIVVGGNAAEPPVQLKSNWEKGQPSAWLPLSSSEELIEAARLLVEAGYSVLPAGYNSFPAGKGSAESRASNTSSRPASADSSLATPALSPREDEILQYLSSGYTNEEIARIVGISLGTVKFHLGHLFEKLGAANRAEAVRNAAELGMLSL